MPKLRVMSAKQVIDILQGHGFTQVRQAGSHIVLRREYVDGNGNVIDTMTAIVPNHSEIALGTLASIIRQSGLPRDLFE